MPPDGDKQGKQAPVDPGAGSAVTTTPTRPESSGPKRERHPDPLIDAQIQKFEAEAALAHHEAAKASEEANEIRRRHQWKPTPRFVVGGLVAGALLIPWFFSYVRPFLEGTELRAANQAARNDSVQRVLSRRQAQQEILASVQEMKYGQLAASFDSLQSILRSQRRLASAQARPDITPAETQQLAEDLGELAERTVALRSAVSMSRFRGTCWGLATGNPLASAPLWRLESSGEIARVASPSLLERIGGSFSQTTSGPSRGRFEGDWGSWELRGGTLFVKLLEIGSTTFEFEMEAFTGLATRESLPEPWKSSTGFSWQSVPCN